MNEDARKVMIAKTETVNLLIDLLYDRNPNIRKYSDAALCIISVNAYNLGN
jgi:hypothetical protein